MANTANHRNEAAQPRAPGVIDAVAVGAGFAGLYALQKLAEQGLSVRAFETGSGVGHLEERNIAAIEPAQESETRWVAHVNEVANRTLYPKAESWYMGSNVPGKARVFMPYVGGIPAYRKICDDVAAEGYRGFVLTPALSEA